MSRSAVTPSAEAAPQSYSSQEPCSAVSCSSDAGSQNDSAASTCSQVRLPSPALSDPTCDIGRA
eukprot:3235677-Heterocapsa_arctica.AAC.1